ncbi:MAG: Ig-like domain-containing protein [Atopobiaceae bacterium]|nr:Ig-like domain-containing protein [Atopobiaceae bacterium]
MLTRNNHSHVLKARLAGAFVVGALALSGLGAPAYAEEVVTGGITVDDAQAQESLELVDQSDGLQAADDAIVLEDQDVSLVAQSVPSAVDAALIKLVDNETYVAIKRVLELNNVKLSDEAVITSARQAYSELPLDTRQSIEQLVPQIPDTIAKAEEQLAELRKSEQVITATDKSVAMGKTVKLGATTTGNGKLTYGCSNTAVATVSSKGVVTPLSVGTAKVIITAASTDTYRVAVKTVNLTVTKGKQTITAADKTVFVGKKSKLGAKTSGDGALTYKSSNTSIATVSSTGVVAGKKAGSVTVTITAAATKNYNKATKRVVVTVSKLDNTLSVAATKPTVTASRKTLASRAVVLSRNVKVSKPVGKVTYANVSTDATAKKFVVNAKTGKVTIPAGTKAGTYKVKIKVVAAGDATHLKAAKKATYNVRVK